MNSLDLRYLSAWSNHHCPILVNSCLNHPDTTLTAMRLHVLDPANGYFIGGEHIPFAILIYASNLLGRNRWIPRSGKQCRYNDQLFRRVEQGLRERDWFMLKLLEAKHHIND